MSITEGVVHQIKDAINIVDLIEEYLPLKKSGKNYVTNCPFHEDDTPSFYVTPELNFFHCFGCGKSGDIITFVMEYEKVPFQEAVRMLANKAGIEIGEFGGKNKVLYSIHDFAAEFYHDSLQKSSKVLGYLGKRGIKEETVDEFQLGFAPSGSEFLRVAKKKFKIEDLLTSGLIKRTGTTVKDRFFLRLLFPLFSSGGQLIGFGGRRLSKIGPKYLNSPDTPIHKKGKNLYSLWHTKEDIRREGRIILVEGYFDFLSLYQAGIKNSVACLGTALTNDQAELLSRYANEVIIFFDRDKAGRAATLRSLGMLLDRDVNVKVGNTGAKKDPDEIILEGGKKEFQRLLSLASELFDYTLDRIKEEYDLASPLGLSKAIERVSAMLSQIKDPIKKEIYRKAVSGKLMIEEYLLEAKEPMRPSSKIEKITPVSEREMCELSLLYAIAQRPEEKDTVFSLINDEEISNPYLRKALRLLKEGGEMKLDDIIESLPKSHIDYLVRENEKPEISVLSSAIRLKNFLLNELKERKDRELQKIEESGGDGSELLREIKDLIEKRERMRKGVTNGI